MAESDSCRELLLRSLMLNLRLGASLGILYSREERISMRDEVSSYVLQVAQQAGLTKEEDLYGLRNASRLQTELGLTITEGLDQ